MDRHPGVGDRRRDLDDYLLLPGVTGMEGTDDYVLFDAGEGTVASVCLVHNVDRAA